MRSDREEGTARGGGSGTGVVMVAAGVVLALGAVAWSLRDRLPIPGDVTDPAAPVPAAEGAASSRSEPAVGPGDDALPDDGAVGAAASVGTEEKLSFDDVERLLALVGAEQRERILGDAQTFRQLVQREALRRLVVLAAESEQMDQEPAVAFSMARRADQVLVDAYIERHVRERLPADFPGDVQLFRFYQENRERFAVAARMPVWQIFLPVPEDAAAAATTEALARARDLAARVRAGEVSFAAAAAEHSRHAASRTNGGYLGLVQGDQLRPAIRERLATLEPGAVSDPVRSDAGVHIVRRGETVPGQALDFDQVRERIRETLRREAAARLRREVLRDVQQRFGTPPPPEAIETWRERLVREGAGAAAGQ